VVKGTDCPLPSYALLGKAAGQIYCTREKSLDGNNLLGYNNFMENILHERDIFKDIIRSLELGKITFLLGSRQTGKTSLMKMALDHFPKKGYKCFYLDMEDARNIPLFESLENLEAFLTSRKSDFKKDKILLAVDEFYVYNNVIKIFKLICDHYKNIRVIASGSSAVEAKANIEESLAGRLRVIDVFPLNFEESLLFKKNPYLENLMARDFKPSDFVISNVEKDLLDMMIFGGYPKVNLLASVNDRIEEIYDIYSTYIQKDIRALLKDEDIVIFNKLVKLLAAQSGQLLSIAAISKALGLGRKTIEKYLFILEKTFIIHLLPPYSANVKKTVVKTPKVYFVDTGMMNMAVENFTAVELRQNKGSIFETFIMGEILKHRKKYHSIYFYRTTHGTEIDFIINDMERGIIPIEVKFKEFQTPVVPKSTLEFCKVEKVQCAYILNKNVYQRKILNGTTFIFLPFISLKKIFE
jgi:predicted AAA+ superfamily ATPase